VLAALRYLRFRLGTWELLAKALRAKHATIKRVVGGHDGAIASLAFRVARLGGSSIDDLLAGKWPDPNACPHCGQIMPKGKRRT
jgi:hypothetical protein